MRIFYSPTSNSFFDDGVHGSRTILIDDEEAKNAAMSDISDREAAILEALEAEEVEEQREIILLDIAAIGIERATLISNPPQKEVDNNDCRLPADAVEISIERHTELMAAQAEGKTWRPGADGLPEIVERERPAEEVLAAARAQRDKALKATDWTQLPDALTKAKREAWAAHRKHLRELPARIEEAIGKGMTATEAAELVQRNVAGTKPKTEGEVK